MDYEKKYKEALERIKDNEPDENGIIHIRPFEIFPELAESEDEKIRKAIISYLKQLRGKHELFPDEWIAWLEKQGEQKPVVSKFKVGDWLVENEPNNYARFIQILEIVNVQGKERYRISRDIHNDEDIVECRFVENNYHPFNIQDAKDGDVIYSRHNTESFEWIGIFKSLDKENKRVFFYGFWHDRAKTFSVCRNEAYVLYDDISPATKEQRDTLLKAMTDAGYTFDFEKKELKKIEQQPAWSKEDKVILDEIIDFFENGTVKLQHDLSLYASWLKSLKDRCTWKPSKGQMKALNTCIMQGEISYVGQGTELQSLYNDLKKLRED